MSRKRNRRPDKDESSKVHPDEVESGTDLADELQCLIQHIDELSKTDRVMTIDDWQLLPIYDAMSKYKLQTLFDPPTYSLSDKEYGLFYDSNACFQACLPLTNYPLTFTSTPVWMNYGPNDVRPCRLPPTVIPSDWVERNNLRSAFLHDIEERSEILGLMKCKIRLPFHVASLPDGGRPGLSDNNRNEQVEVRLFDFAVHSNQEGGDGLKGTVSYPPCFMVDYRHGEYVKERMKVRVKSFNPDEHQSTVFPEDGGVPFANLPMVEEPYEVPKLTEQIDSKFRACIELVQSITLDWKSVEHFLNSYKQLNLDLYANQVKAISEDLTLFRQRISTGHAFAIALPTESQSTIRLYHQHDALQSLKQCVHLRCFPSFFRMILDISVRVGYKSFNNMLDIDDDGKDIINKIAILKDQLQDPTIDERKTPKDVRDQFLKTLKGIEATVEPLMSLCKLANRVKRTVASLKQYASMVGLGGTVYIPDDRRVQPNIVLILQRSIEAAPTLASLQSWMVDDEAWITVRHLDLALYFSIIVGILAPEGEEIGGFTEEAKDHIEDPTQRAAQIDEDHSQALFYFSSLIQMVRNSNESRILFETPVCHQQADIPGDPLYPIDYSHNYNTTFFQTHIPLGAISNYIRGLARGMMLRMWELETLCLSVCYENKLDDAPSQIILDILFKDLFNDLEEFISEPIKLLLHMTHCWVENCHNLSNCLKLSDSIQSRMKGYDIADIWEMSMLHRYKEDPEKLSRLPDYIGMATFAKDERAMELPRQLRFMPFDINFVSLIAVPSNTSEEDTLHAEKYPFNHVAYHEDEHKSYHGDEHKSSCTPWVRRMQPPIRPIHRGKPIMAPAIKFHCPLLNTDDNVDIAFVRKCNAIVTTMYQRGYIDDLQQAILYRQIEETGRWGEIHGQLESAVRWIGTKMEMDQLEDALEAEDTLTLHY